MQCGLGPGEAQSVDAGRLNLPRFGGQPMTR
jgi:hypothetical protein